jgi:hypothetical protein
MMVREEEEEEGTERVEIRLICRPVYLSGNLRLSHAPLHAPLGCKFWNRLQQPVVEYGKLAQLGLRCSRCGAAITGSGAARPGILHEWADRLRTTESVIEQISNKGKA